MFRKMRRIRQQISQAECVEILNRATSGVLGLHGDDGYAHIAFSLGSQEKVNDLTGRLKADGYEIVSGPRTTGDGYYESCIIDVENNRIELTV